jgi:hypothetical protein
MYARVTLLEIDPVRIDPHAAVELFERQVLPVVREQPGYEGCYVLANEEGKGILISLWETEEAAATEGGSGIYSELLGRYVTLFRSPPGRERYEVAVADLPARGRPLAADG